MNLKDYLAGRTTILRLILSFSCFFIVLIEYGGIFGLVIMIILGMIETSRMETIYWKTKFFGVYERFSELHESDIKSRKEIDKTLRELNLFIKNDIDSVKNTNNQ